MKAHKTLAQFRRGAVRVFLKANPDAKRSDIEWIESLRIVKWADGSSGFRGSFRASADGYAPRVMHATWCGGMSVR